MSEEELKKQYGLFTEAWKLYKKWAARMPIDDSQWEQFVMESKEIKKNYETSDTVKYLLLAVTSGLCEEERKCLK